MLFRFVSSRTLSKSYSARSLKVRMRLSSSIDILLKRTVQSPPFSYVLSRVKYANSTRKRTIRLKETKHVLVFWSVMRWSAFWSSFSAYLSLKFGIGGICVARPRRLGDGMELAAELVAAGDSSISMISWLRIEVSFLRSESFAGDST